MPSDRMALAVEDRYVTSSESPTHPDAPRAGGETPDRIHKMLDEIEARLSAATRGPIYVADVEANDGNVCIKHDHFDLYTQHGEVEPVSSVLGGFEAQRLTFRAVNVGCYLGERPDAVLFANAARDIQWLTSQLRSALLARHRDGERAEPAASPEPNKEKPVIQDGEFHQRNGWYFKSFADGSVQIRHEDATSDIVHVIPANEWISIAAHLAYAGSAEAYERARQLFERPSVPPAAGPSPERASK